MNISHDNTNCSDTELAYFKEGSILDEPSRSLNNFAEFYTDKDIIVGEGMDIQDLLLSVGLNTRDATKDHSDEIIQPISNSQERSSDKVMQSNFWASLMSLYYVNPDDRNMLDAVKSSVVTTPSNNVVFPVPVSTCVGNDETTSTNSVKYGSEKNTAQIHESRYTLPAVDRNHTQDTSSSSIQTISSRTFSRESLEKWADEVEKITVDHDSRDANGALT